ncbi:polymer-forming cytoskeletal protein [Romboutsia sp. 1001713B170207_170306_H8]|uniref:polymer-forming cytoskeletal protein n=1 Tax=Romboutsia sp. 1001713B170207_170306_H8 TaxID=2787112 RepID=UPI00189984D5|nr:polymer-forming cytoskeletal protein [Romboutsia sp. 1001713B170207_170306_H8]
MKKRIICIFTTIVILMFSIVAFAEDTTTSSNLFSCDSNIAVNKDVDGDVYTFGNSISIGNIIGGDIISAGRDINIQSSEVKGNIRTASQTVNIDVGRTKNITVAGESINIGDKTNANAIYLAASDISFKGETNDFYASAQTIVIDGTVNGNLNVDCENITFTENAVVKGNIKVKSSNEPNLNSKMSMSDIDYEKITTNNEEEGIFTKSNIVDFLISLVAAIITGLILYVLLNKSLFGFDRKLSKSYKYLLIGLAVLIIMPILSLLLIISVICVPVGIIILILYGIIIYLCPVILGIILGQLILSKQNPILQVLLGILIIKVLLLIPYISFIIWFLSVLFILGLITMKLYSYICKK